MMTSRPTPSRARALTTNPPRARVADDGDGRILQPPHRALAEELAVPQEGFARVVSAPRPVVPEDEVVAGDRDAGKRRKRSVGQRGPPEEVAAGEHDGAPVGEVGVDPAEDGREQLAVRGVVERREPVVAAGVAVDLEDREPPSRRVGEDVNHRVRPPRHPVRPPHRAVGVGDGEELVDEERHAGGGDAPPAERDGDGLLPVPGKRWARRAACCRPDMRSE